jgi:hypothetical protein
LSDDSGQTIGEVEGSMEDAASAGGAARGTFEAQETDELMQAVLEGKTFGLNVEGGSQLSIRAESASVSSKPGFTTVKFASV